MPVLKETLGGGELLLPGTTVVPYISYTRLAEALSYYGTYYYKY